MRTFIISQLLWLIIFHLPTSSFSQALIADTEIILKLSDQTEVHLMESTSTQGNEERIFYYIPTNFRLSTKRNSELPEFSFLGYRDDDDGPLTGGIMHFLVTWGLTKSQEEEADSLLNEIDSTAVIWGAALIQTENDGGKLEFLSKNQFTKTLINNLQSMGKVPVLPGTKLASSFHFKGEDAEFIAKNLANPAKMKDSEIGIKFFVEIIDSGRSGRQGYLRPMMLKANLKDWFLLMQNP